MQCTCECAHVGGGGGGGGGGVHGWVCVYSYQLCVLCGSQETQVVLPCGHMYCKVHNRSPMRASTKERYSLFFNRSNIV